MTPVSTGRKNAASFFLEEEERGKSNDEEGEAEGQEDVREQENPESTAEEEDQGGDDEEWLPRGAAAVAGSLAEAARTLTENDSEEELQSGADEQNPVRIQGESQDLLDRTGEFLQELELDRNMMNSSTSSGRLPPREDQEEFAPEPRVVDGQHQDCLLWTRRKRISKALW